MTQIIRPGDISLHDLEMQFNLQRNFAEDFFSKWQGDLPKVTDLEQPLLDRLKAGYFNLIGGKVGSAGYQSFDKEGSLVRNDGF